MIYNLMLAKRLLAAAKDLIAEESTPQTQESFQGQIYSDSTGEYKVEDVLQYIVSMNMEPQLLKVSDLVDVNFKPSPDEIADEVPGSPEFIERAERADLTYPIIAVEYPDGVFIVDGVHRLWKAAATNMENISTFLLTPEDLKNIPHQPEGYYDDSN